MNEPLTCCPDWPGMERYICIHATTREGLFDEHTEHTIARATARLLREIGPHYAMAEDICQRTDLEPHRPWQRFIGLAKGSL